VKYLVAPVAALLCAASIVLPAAAAPSATASFVMTCDRGAGAIADVTFFRDGAIVGHAQQLTCGLASPSGARSARARVDVSAEPDTVGYNVVLAYPEAPQPGCNVWTQVPNKITCPVDNFTGSPNVYLSAR
jgi:hypothetical protein